MTKKNEQTKLRLGASTLPSSQHTRAHIKEERYELAPIKGYPMLNWRGKRPFTSTQHYPAQLKEIHGEEVGGWRNKIFWGDNLQVMSHLLKNFRGKIDLIYIDPPFDSKVEYKKTIALRGTSVSSNQTSFEEKQYGDIWTNDEYLQFMYERLVLAKELLAGNGSIFLHCDWHKVHHLRCLMDEVFGASSFVNEIIWHYRKWSMKARNFQRNHDNILWYSTSTPSERVFNVVEVQEASEGTLKRWKGMKQRAVFDDDGNRTATSVEEESEGAPLADVWALSIINPAASERLDYPTQKPEQLIERIVRHASNEGDLVLDFFMGSGTTQAVAMKLGRRFIGADINLGAIQTTTKRLISLTDKLRDRPQESNATFTGFESYNVNNYDVFRNPIQAKDLLTEALEVQRIEYSTVFDGEKDGRMIKIMPVNRIATRADLNELIAGFDYKAWQRRQGENANKAVEKITLVCMGHEPDLAAQLELAAKPFKIDVEVVDILRDKANLEFRRDSEAKVFVKNGELVIEKFFPMNLLQKLSLQKQNVGDWREMVESVLIDWNFDGAVLQPTVVDIPDKDDLVKGAYEVPKDAGTIRVKITDLLSESWEGSIS